ncbi:hypothetical protein H4582DRAFT_2085539 [Lactarius indigo]|nr:hypothetical protein H4582DRAFT_2085539 [Lactarius indigo]
MPLIPIRLPTEVRPRHYDLTIRTDLEKEKFTGFVKIDLEFVKATKIVTFNAAAELLLGPATLVLFPSGTHLAPTETKFDASTERASLTFAEELPIGIRATLHLGFASQPTGARSALPCWDEPLLKATFSVTLISRKGTVSLSNMPALSDAPVADADTKALFEGVKEGSWYATKFETTPPMSTYLVALANGEFVYLESSYKSPLSGKIRPLRVYTTPDMIDQAQYALDVKEKLDTLIANNMAGALENWGLIIGTSTAYLVDPENADIAAKKRIAETQSHEIAHMWFGNITTMKWWDNLYLNEGFATLACSITQDMGEKVILDKIYPEWKVDVGFINNHLNVALRLDAKLSSHPIEVAVPDAGQIGQIFDSLSYSKAASVLRMLSKFVGEEKFLKGVSLYLKKHLYSNTVSRNLWEGISEATGLDVPRIMDNWVSKMGFPVLTGDRDSNWGQDHVLYTPTRLAAIASEAAKTDSIFSLGDRIGLVHDAFALGKAGYLKLSAGARPRRGTPGRERIIDKNLDGITHVWWESEKVVEQLKVFRRVRGRLSTDTGSLSHLLKSCLPHRLCAHPSLRNSVLEYSKDDSADITQLAHTRLSPARQPAGDYRVRLSWTASLGTSRAISLPFPVDLLSVTLSTAVKHTGAPAYDAVLKLFENPNTPSIKIAAIRGLTSPVDCGSTGAHIRLGPVKEALNALREFFEANYLLCRSHLPLVLCARSTDELGEPVIDQQALRDDVLDEICHPGGSVYSGFGKEEDRVKAEAFFKDKDTRQYNQALAQALDGISAKAAFIERSTSDIITWLEKWGKAPRSAL